MFLFSKIEIVNYHINHYKRRTRITKNTKLSMVRTNSHWSYDHLFYLRERFLQFLSATLAKSGPLDFPSEKSFLLFFAHEKGLGHMFQE